MFEVTIGLLVLSAAIVVLWCLVFAEEAGDDME